MDSDTALQDSETLGIDNAANGDNWETRGVMRLEK